MTATISNANSIRSATLPQIDDASSFDGDVLLAYCAAHLNELGADIKNRMNAQKAVRDAKSALTALQTNLSNHTTTGNMVGDAAGKKEILHLYADAINKMPPGKERDGVIASLQEFRKTACCQDQTPPPFIDGPKGTCSEETINSDVALAGAQKNNVDLGEFKVQVENLSKISEDLGKNAELEMIDLQQLVSQRQTAIQSTTQLLTKYGQGVETICANIGK